MRKKSKAKNPVNQTIFQSIVRSLKNRLQLKFRLRQSVNALLIAAILTTTLFVDWDWLKTWAQGSCYGPDQIFQGCALGGGQVEADLTNQAVDDVIGMYRLTADRTLVIRSLRNEVRAMLYIRLLALIKKPNKTAAEVQALATFAGKIKESRVRAAIAARDEYHLWQQNPCGGYQPPAPYTYRSPGCTFYTIILNGGPYAPTFEEFQQYGVARANGATFTDDAKIVAEKTGLAVRNAAGLGTTFAATTLGVLIGQTLTFGTLNGVLPFAANSWGLWVENGAGVGQVIARAWGTNLVKIPQAATASSGTAGGVGLGGPIAVISTAIQILVTQTINVVNQNNLPGKLDQAIVDLQNANVNLNELLATDPGNSEIYLNFVLQTLPDYSALVAPAPQPTDRQFVVYDQETSQTYETPVLNARLEWENNRYSQLRLTGGLFAYPEQPGEPSADNPLRQQVVIRYLDWDNKIKMAYRTGLLFYIVDPTNPQQTRLYNELKMKVDNRNVIVKIKQTQMQAFEVGTTPVSCGVVFNGGQGGDIVLGKVTDAGEPASTLSATVNGGASATVAGINVSNMRVNNNYEVIGKVESINAPTPTIASFTVTVSNTVGQQNSFPVEVKKTAVDNTLPKETLGRMTLGGYFETTVSFGLEISCSNSQVTASGDLPPGLKIGRQEGNLSGNTYLFGTPTSAGKYNFTLTKQYANGESVSQDYVVVVNTDLVKLDDSATSWWRAESGVDDHFKRANGTIVGNIGFDTGKVNRGFVFDGSDSYIRLPENTFSPGNNFTFETWFKTDRSGVILGSQPVADPYGSSNGATPLVYVTNDGKLQVQMFKDQYNRSIKTERSVDDNQYHHVAVTYTAGDQMRRVYLDGEEVGSLFGGQLAGSTKYQFGTGYATDAANGGANGWLNFNGVIDEPTVYNRALSQQDIKKIYAVGGFGKLYLKIRPYAPQVRDGSDGGLLMDAQSASALNYKLRWQNPANPITSTAEQDTSNFLDLRPANYSITIEDDFGNKYETSAIVPNAPASIEVSTEVQQPQCAYETSGSIRIISNGGSIPFGANLKYSILGGVVQQDSNVFTNLGARTYYPRIHDLSTNTDYEGQQVTMTAGPAPFALSPAAFPNAQQNQPYSQTFTLSGNTAPYNLRAEGLDVNTNYELPAGLIATVTPNSITFSGTPTVTGTFPIRILYSDQRSCADSKTINLTVVAPGNVSIGGRVTNGGQGIPNATVTLSGGANKTTTTDATGNYSFINLSPNQNYVATVSLPGYTFAQSSQTFSAVNANVGNGDFATAFMHYEGDIAPRAAGDGKVDVRDYVTINRIYNNQEAQPAAGGEWQRASVSPRSSLGSTRMLSSDAPQILRYIVRNDPLTLVGGPSVPASPRPAENALAKILSEPLVKLPNGSPENQSFTSSAAAATVSAASVNYTGGTVSVPISLTSDGTMAAAQFTVSYDDSKLTLQSVAGGGDVNNQFALNTDTPGKITVAAYRLGNGNFPANVTLMKLNFTVKQGATGNAPIDFTDAPTERLASDAQGGTITVGSSGGMVILAAPTAASVSVSGRILVGNTGVANAAVFLTDQNGETRTARTTSFGFYRFEDVPAGQTYTATVVSRRYKFQPQIVSVTQDVSDLNFIADSK